MTLNFEKEDLIKQLKDRKPKKVLVQLPEGVKQNIVEISEIFEELGIEVVYSGETCWGGCAIAIHEASDVGADLIVHFGHAVFIEVDFPVIYIEVRDELDLSSILKKSLDSLKGIDKIGLSYSIQHRHDVDNVIKFYEDNGKEVFLSKKRGHAAYEGHVVGCEYTGLKSIVGKVDAFVVLGNQFHGMGATLAVEKPVFLLDVYNDDVRSMDGLRDKILRQRAIAIDRLKEAKTVGVIMESKPGQKFGSADYIMNALKKAGKKAFLITMSELSNEKLMNFYYIDAFIELACPRIALDDYAKYEKPVLTFKEGLVGLGIKSWDDLLEMGVV